MVAPAHKSRVPRRRRADVPPPRDGPTRSLRDSKNVARAKLPPSRVTEPATGLPQLTAILAQVPFGVIIVAAPSGKPVFCNALAARTWPSVLRPPAALDVAPCRLTRSPARPVADGDWPWVRALATDTVVDEEIQFLARNGTRIAMDVRCTPVHEHGGRVSAVVVILHDVSERQRVERALQASRAQYESLYQDAPDMFASLTVDSGYIAQCNQTLMRATGYSREELLGRPVRDIHQPSCWPTLARALQRVRGGDQVREVELQLRRKNGETIEASLAVAAIRDERGELYHRSTWRDITARKRAQAVAHQKHEELERSRQDLQALAGRLLTAQEDERRRISRELHDDLNQRLAMLSLELEALHEHLPRSRAAIVERVHALRNGVVELSDAVHGLAYQLYASVLDDLGLPAALESLLAGYAQRGVEIDFRQERVLNPLPREVASCLYRVAQEALHNVARHARAVRVTLRLAPARGGIRMVIADDGVGFDVPNTQNVGSRLGILGMHERVRLVHGRLTLTSRLGTGTQLDVWVPVHKEGEDASADSAGR